MSQPNDILLYDGDCLLCSKWMRFLKKRLKESLQFVVQSESEEMIATLPEDMRSIDSMFLIRKGRPHAKSSAAIRCLLYLGWHWKVLFPLAWLVPLPIRDKVYSIISNRRHN